MLAREPLRNFARGTDISAADERQLANFAGRMRRLQIHKNLVTVGEDLFEIYVGAAGYTIVSINGRRNPYLREQS